MKRSLNRTKVLRVLIIVLALVAVLAVVLYAALGGPALPLGGQVSGMAPYATALYALATFAVILVFGGPLGEEAGWRGYALPRLQARLNTLPARLVLGVLWGLWHLPLFWSSGPSQSVFPFVPFMAWVVALSVLFTWVDNGTRGSLLMAVLFHAAINAAPTLLSGQAFLRVMSDPEAVWLYVGLVCAVAGATAPAHLSRKPHLGRRAHG